MARTIYDNEYRRNKIIEYVREHSRPTKTEVIRYMDNQGSSIMTTHGLISQLVSDKILIVQKDKPNSQTHHLLINDESPFNRINKELSEVETIVNKSGEAYRKKKEFINRLSMPSERVRMKKEKGITIPSMSGEDINQIREFEQNYEDVYRNSVPMRLYHLLFEVSTEIHSENVSRSLNARIVELMKRTVLQFHPLDKSDQYFDWINRKLETRIRKMSARNFTKNDIFNLQLMRDLLALNQSFIKEK